MSVNIVLKDKNKVYLAVDSQATKGGRKFLEKNLNNIKMWKIDSVDSCYIAHCGDARDSCIIRILDDLIEPNVEVDFSYVASEVKHKIVQALVDSEYIDLSNGYIEKIPSSFFIVYKNKAFAIEQDLSVIEIEDYEAHGSGKYIATGNLASTVGIDPLERLKKALKASCNNIYVDFPVYVVDTKTNEILTINEEDL